MTAIASPARKPRSPKRQRKSAQIIKFPTNRTSTITWGEQQAAALDAFRAWRQDPNGKQVFRLLGVAGTGKTLLARTLAEDETAPVFVAFTGKAASVLRRHGCPDACTIHQLLYGRADKCVDYLQEDELVVSDNQSPPPEPEWAQRRGPLTFTVNPRQRLRDASLIVVDEASMVDDDVYADLTALNIRILALGDPAQLPPVGNGRRSMMAETPDVFLTEIHRQALDSPIVGLASMARTGESIRPGQYGESVVASNTIEEVCKMECDQILCGLNRIRQLINKTVRANKGIKGWLPQPGERLVCLKNIHSKGLLNGTIWICQHVATGRGLASGQPIIELGLESEDDGIRVLFNCPVRDFYQYFDFGYALTVHKAQGSEWPHVILIDEGFAFREDEMRWRYTGITRATERVSLIRLSKVGTAGVPA